MVSGIKNLEELKQILKSNKKIKLKVKVAANSKNNSIEFLEDFVRIRVKQRAAEGRANKAVIDFLSDELKYPRTKINILNGHKSQIKTIELG